MNVQEIISKLSSYEIDLYLDAESKLKAKAPKGAINNTLASLIKNNKSELITYLKQLDRLSIDKNAISTIQVVSRECDQLPVSFAQQRL
ncbi:hypothetical protein, partial [Pseudoalteromonas luteoviolacea]|uniref:TubC N-terminal docking domain-related protein n=1 Tax=Pseudoalteromonas luteoviolacea TaxID=43657 RepID=UPI000B236CC4